MRAETQLPAFMSFRIWLGLSNIPETQPDKAHSTSYKCWYGLSLVDVISAIEKPGATRYKLVFSRWNWLVAGQTGSSRLCSASAPRRPQRLKEARREYP